MRILNVSRRQLKAKFKEKVKDLTDEEAERAVDIVLEYLRTEVSPDPEPPTPNAAR